MQIKGAYWPQSADGTLGNPCVRALVAPSWAELADACVARYREELGGDLVGVYLRGSVPRGRAVNGLSDLDTFALVSPRKGGPGRRWETPEWAGEAEQYLAAGFPFVAGIEFTLVDWNGADQTDPRIQFLIAHESLCWEGRDVRAEIPPFRIDALVLKRNLRWLEQDWLDVQDALKADRASVAQVRSFLKTLIRSAFEVVMDRKGAYSTDLLVCARDFGEFHPGFRSQMEALTGLFEQPEGRTGELPALAGPLVGFLLSGEWGQ